MNLENAQPLTRRWTIAWLLGLGVLINYFDRVNLSVSHAALQTTFGISDIAFGYLSGAYNWTYALCQLPIGVVLDRLGVKRVGRISTFLWSLASFGAAITPNLTGFFASRFLLGIGEAPTFPANAKAIGLWFPPRERSFSTAIFDSAAKLAAAIGVPVIGVLLLHVGWRWSFAATGVVSLLYCGLFWRVYRDPAEQARPSEQITHTGEQPSLWGLLRQRKVLGLSIGFGAYNYVFYLLLSWLPSYLSSALHVDLLHSFLFTGVPWLFAFITDLCVGGLLVDRLVARGLSQSTVRRTVLIAGTACGLGILGATHAHTPAQALIWISLSIGGLAAAAPVGWSVPALIAPAASVGRVGGILNFSNQISGILAPIITGYLVARQHSFAGAFTVAAAYLVFGLLSYVFLLGPIEPFTK